ncbi:hypothetical protein DFP72DRAFT_1077359 [Ephemerocybe angulata]|uniref:Uncharacterized protein n=1 Tax=Ephemerocybe angulata TaxID=980116 RepID=A0A8H6LYA8_9AGAR|nr:hypothetical protein DFP72DRAFT_1077359 [Tulosesus angulatus]
MSTTGLGIYEPVSRAYYDEALTLQCNKCSRPIFGDMEISATECCAELYCAFCWDDIVRLDGRCLKPGCEDVYLKPVPIYWAEDTDSILSKERDYRRQILLEGDPRFQQIQEKTQMQATLDDHIRQMSGRTEATHAETRSIKNLAEQMRVRTQEVVANNVLLAAKIEAIKAQTANLENRGSGSGTQ